MPRRRALRLSEHNTHARVERLQGAFHVKLYLEISRMEMKTFSPR